MKNIVRANDKITSDVDPRFYLKYVLLLRTSSYHSVINQVIRNFLIPRTHRHLANRAFAVVTLYQTMFVTPKVIATFYPNLKLTILTLHFITVSSVSCAI